MTELDRLTQIEREEAEHLAALDRLRLERTRLLVRLLDRPGPALFFGEDGRTIRWDGGRMQLGGKSHQLLKTLWQHGGSKHRVKINRLGRIVWGDEFVDGHVIAALVSSIKNRLERATFPYELISVKNPRTGERIGYRLQPE